MSNGVALPFELIEACLDQLTRVKSWDDQYRCCAALRRCRLVNRQWCEAAERPFQKATSFCVDLSKPIGRRANALAKSKALTLWTPLPAKPPEYGYWSDDEDDEPICAGNCARTLLTALKMASKVDTLELRIGCRCVLPKKAQLGDFDTRAIKALIFRVQPCERREEEYAGREGTNLIRCLLTFQHISSLAVWADDPFAILPLRIQPHLPNLTRFQSYRVLFESADRSRTGNRGRQIMPADPDSFRQVRHIRTDNLEWLDRPEMAKALSQNLVKLTLEDPTVVDYGFHDKEPDCPDLRALCKLTNTIELDLTDLITLSCLLWALTSIPLSIATLRVRSDRSDISDMRYFVESIEVPARKRLRPCRIVVVLSKASCKRLNEESDIYFKTTFDNICRRIKPAGFELIAEGTAGSSTWVLPFGFWE